MNQTLSKIQIKDIRALHQKKYRHLENLFFVEGEKMVQEALKSSFDVSLVVSTSEVFLQQVNFKNSYVVSEKIMEQITALASPSKAFAVVCMKENRALEDTRLDIFLDSLQDAGNVGTIIRTADWFGVFTIYIAPNSVDVYNPKLIQATMGSFFRMSIQEKSIEDVLNQKKYTSIYAADMRGKSIYETSFSEKNLLVIGSEAHGVSDHVKKHITEAITIPKIGAAESLNASMAAGIILSEYARKS